MNLAEAKDAGVISGWEHGAREAVWGTDHLYPWERGGQVDGHDRKMAFEAGWAIGHKRWEDGLNPDGTQRAERELPTGESTGPYRHLVFSNRDNAPRGAVPGAPYDTIEAAQRVPSDWFRVWIIDAQGRCILTGSHPGTGGTGRRWAWVKCEGMHGYPMPTPETRMPLFTSRQPDATWADENGLWHAVVGIGPDEEEEARSLIAAQLAQQDGSAVAMETGVTMVSTFSGKRVYRESRPGPASASGAQE